MNIKTVLGRDVVSSDSKLRIDQYILYGESESVSYADFKKWLGLVLTVGSELKVLNCGADIFEAIVNLSGEGFRQMGHCCFQGGISMQTPWGCLDVLKYERLHRGNASGLDLVCGEMPSFQILQVHKIVSDHYQNP